MESLPVTASDPEIIAFVDRWADLLEGEDYAAAFALTGHVADMGWSARLIREVITGYGDARRGQRVTMRGVPTDLTQRKDVTRWPSNRHGSLGEVWYDLNIDGRASDLTATFQLRPVGDRLELHLNDIHVM